MNKYIILGLFLLWNTYSSYSQAIEKDSLDKYIELLYKESDLIFTGFLNNKFQRASTINPDENSSFLMEFDVTEIQKGKRRQKVLTSGYSSDSLQIGYEYLVFIKKGNNSSGAENRTLSIHRVCPKCENKEIRNVYYIVSHKPLRKIKSPLPSYTKGNGCGCY